MPDRTAVICDGRRLTFSELEQRANQVANALLSKGVVAGDPVIVYLPNSVELTEAIAGIIKSGALLVPVSTRLGKDEIAYIIGHCRPKAIFFPIDHADNVPSSALNIAVGEGGDFEEFVASGDTRPPPGLAPQPDDCVISYTSGTTGNPKGAIGTHMNMILGSGIFMAREWGLTSNDVIMAGSPMAHRTGLSRLGNCFQVGCALVMQPRFDAADAVRLMVEEKVTVFGGVPTIVRMLMPEIEAHTNDLGALRLIVTTGEAFPESLKTRLFTALPTVGLSTYLASTEGGVIAILGPDEQQSHANALGKPLPGIEHRIVDRDLKDVALGETGEILVRCGLPGQYTVMRAYLNDEKATSDAFVDGWFRTGDLVYGDEEGYLYFVDRQKDMIVSGGLNIYSKEVELALLDHPEIEDAAVFAVPDAEFGEAVMACVQLVDSGSMTAEHVIGHCREILASYKKPKYVEFVKEFPRNSTGKVRKFELKKRFFNQTDRPLAPE